MKKFLSVLLAVILLMCVFPVISAEGIGIDISGFETTDLLGNPVNDDILQNADITVINYWATWCGPCCGELPYFQAMHEYYTNTPEADVQIIGAICESNGCTPGKAQNYLEQHEITYTNIRCDAKLRDVFKTNGAIPQTLIVDREGVVRMHRIGAFSPQSALQEFIDTWHDIVANHAGETGTVTYINGTNGAVIDTVDAPYGYLVPEPPEAPEVIGHEFTGWQYSGDLYIAESSEETNYIVTGDVTVTAVYKANEYKVKFFDGVDGNLISIQKVEYGKAAIAPEHPEHEGYIFTGWDTDFSCVTEPLSVHGICVPVSDTPDGDVNLNGTVDTVDVLLALRCAMSVSELTDEQAAHADMNQDGIIDTIDVLLILRKAMEL